MICKKNTVDAFNKVLTVFCFVGLTIILIIGADKVVSF